MFAQMWLSFLLISVASLKGITANTDRPIIGVAAQELGTYVKEKFPQHSSYIAASYVKAIESSGAQVVPIPVNKSDSYYRALLKTINGIVLPGGGSNFGPGKPYYDLVKKIYTIAVELNEQNIPFPILAICLGFEFMLGVANKDKNILKSCELRNVNLPLKFLKPYSETRYFSFISSQEYKLLTTENITANYHRWCFMTDDFIKEPLLNNNWVITTVSKKSQNKRDPEFIASVEHEKYPFFGLQFHPEKSAFEWKRGSFYKHTQEAVLANRYFYDIFVHFARKNNQKFSNLDFDDKALIYNFPVSFTPETSYTQIYFDPDPDNRRKV